MDFSKKLINEKPIEFKKIEVSNIKRKKILNNWMISFII